LELGLTITISITPSRRSLGCYFQILKDEANDLTFTKARIVELFNGMAYPLYLLKQNRWRYPGENAVHYLKITEDNVFLDDEVDKFTSENTWYNSEFFAVDFAEQYIWCV
jgi:hypothetical protein